MSRKSHLQQIKEYLEWGNSLNELEAFEKFGCKRLTPIINELKKAGMKFTIELDSNQYGKHFAKYTLIKI